MGGGEEGDFQSRWMFLGLGNEVESYSAAAEAPAG